MHSSKTANQDAHRIGWIWSQNRGKSEGYEKWNKENKQGTNSDGKETGTQINDLDQKEEINIQPEQNEQTRIQKNEERIRNLWDNFKCSNIQIIGVPEGEGQEQEMENLFEQIMKENFPNLAKEIYVQEVQRVPNRLDQKEERNIQPEKYEETRIWKNEGRLRNLQDIFKHSNIRIIGAPEGEEKSKKLKTYLKK